MFAVASCQQNGHCTLSLTFFAFGCSFSAASMQLLRQEAKPFSKGEFSAKFRVGVGRPQLRNGTVGYTKFCEMIPWLD